MCVTVRPAESINQSINVEFAMRRYSKENLKIHTGSLPSRLSASSLLPAPLKIHVLTFKDAQINFNDTHFV